MAIGNIVSESKSKLNEFFNVVEDINNINKEIPTLIIGWDFSKRLFGDRRLSILSKDIGNNMMWTFTKREKRRDHEKDLSFFIKKCIKNLCDNYNYRYINLLTENLTSIKNLIEKLTSSKEYYIYIDKNSFIYIKMDNETIGIDFNTIDYLGVDRKKIYNILFKGNKVIFSDKFLHSDIKDNIEYKQRIIAHLYETINGNRNEI